MAGDTDYSRYRPLSVVLAGIVLSYMALGVWNNVRTPVLGVMFCPGHEICRVYDGSPAAEAGIRRGDKILAVDGAPIPDVGPLGPGPARTGEVRIYEIERAGEIIELEVTLADPPPHSIYLRLGPTIVGLCFVLTGLHVFRRRPTRVSGILLLFCLSVGWMLSSPPYLAGPYSRFVAGATEITAWFGCASLLVYFFWIFPRSKRLIGNNTYLVILLFSLAGAAALALIAVLGYTLVLGLQIPRRVLVLLDYLAGFIIIGYFVLAAASFMHSYFTTSPSSVKTNLRLLLAGAIVGVAPVIVYSVMFAIDPQKELPLEGHVVLFTMLIPLSLGHVVLRLPPEDTPAELA